MTATEEGTEQNNFKRAINDARTVLREAVTSLAGSNGMGQDVTTKIASHEGWVCDAADDWVADFTGRCPAVMGEFDTALAELNSAWQGEPDTVDEGNWRGIAYHSSRSGRPSRMPL